MRYPGDGYYVKYPRIYFNCGTVLTKQGMIVSKWSDTLIEIFRIVFKNNKYLSNVN